jgi:hypothetical protein
LENLKILTFLSGRGAFYVFLGTLELAIWDSPLHLILGIVLVSGGRWLSWFAMGIVLVSGRAHAVIVVVVATFRDAGSCGPSTCLWYIDGIVACPDLKPCC